MSKLLMLRQLVKQQLDSAADKICEEFERTASDYEEELSQFRENGGKLKLLNAVFNPRVQLNRLDVQQPLVKAEVTPDTSYSLDQVDTGPLHIKEEQEELWTYQEEGQLHGPNGVNITRFPFTAVPVKSEGEEEKLHRIQNEGFEEAEPPISSSAKQMVTEIDREDCGGSQPARYPDPNNHLPQNTDDKDPVFSETDVGDGDDGDVEDWQKPLSDSALEDSDNDWNETRAPESLVNAVKYKDTPVCDVSSNAAKKSVKKMVDLQTRVHTGEKPYGCDICGKTLTRQYNVRMYMRVHAGEKPFGCDICGKGFAQKGALKKHIRVHTGGKPFHLS